VEEAEVSRRETMKRCRCLRIAYAFVAGSYTTASHATEPGDTATTAFYAVIARMRPRCGAKLFQYERLCLMIDCRAAAMLAK
jgi:hypothetical protein